MQNLYPIASSLLVFLGLATCIHAYRLRYPRSSLPPGPTDRMKPNEHNWEAYFRWSRQLGPLVTVSAGIRPVIVVCTQKAVHDLLTQKKTFACRPRFPMADLMGRQNNVGFAYYGKRLIKTRALLHSSLSSAEVNSTWVGLIDIHSKLLCTLLAKSPENFSSHVESNIQKLICRFTYGYDPDSDYLRTAKQVVEHTGQALQPGRWAVNKIPALKWVPMWAPGAGFKRWAYQEMETNTAEPSFVRQSLWNLSTPYSFDDENLISSAAGSLFSAGTETLFGTIMSFIILMANHEDIQDRAYTEIVSVVGSNRLPSPENRSALVFVDSIIQEVHRFNPAVPLAHHSNYEETEYEGMRIPKKTWVIGNIWAVLHEEATYKDPYSFFPERFSEGKQSTIPPDPRVFVYGFGRRRCPGLHFADMTVFLIVARILALFKILPENVDGQERRPPLQFTKGFVPTPKPFRCQFVLREHGTEIISSIMNDGS